MWLIIPLIYFLGWWQTGSFRQAFNGTIAWIIGYAIFAGTILMLDVGGYDRISATPDSPMAGLAILGGFIGMWASNILWRRRGGDPPRKPGKWERTARAMFGAEKKKKKPARGPVAPPPQQAPPPPHQQAPQSVPVDAQYRPVANHNQAPQQAPPAQQPPPPQYRPAQQQFAQQQAPPAGQGQTYSTQPQQQAPPRRKSKSSRSSPTADKYAKATGRALGAMFRGSNKKKSNNN